MSERGSLARRGESGHRRRVGEGSAPEMTQLLHAAASGDRLAAAAVLPRVYAELRALASARLARLPPGQTLQATALVHEAWAGLVGGGDPGWNSRNHFFAAAAHAMRDLLVDRARRKAAAKRGGDMTRSDVDVELQAAGGDLQGEDLLALDEALERLRREHPRRAEVVILGFYGGLPHAEIAEHLGVTTRTVEREWRFARAWLHAALEGR